MGLVELAGSLQQSKDLRQEIEAKSGVDLSKCYQCGKCSAGCPLAFAMDYTPRQLIRMLQLGLVDEALGSHTPWLCVSCQACYTRCPREINLPRLMEVIRQEARRRGIIKEKNVEIFDQAFLSTVRRYGRSHEMEIVIRYNLLSMQPFKDAMLGPPMLLKGKLSPLPARIKDTAAMKNIFARAEAKAKGGDKH